MHIPVQNSYVIGRPEKFYTKDQPWSHLKVARVRCEKDLLFFTRYFFHKQNGYKFVIADLHRQICEALTMIYTGEIKNLVINLPPRYGKTIIAVQSFIAWSLANNPSAKFIHLSYSDQLALDNSARIKETIQSEAFQELWPVKLKQDSKSKKLWYTEQGGGVYATAAGGPITGFGAGSTVSTGKFDGAIIIDDPLKPDDAHSEIERNKVNARLTGTIQSRRNDPGKTPIIIIMQRLHEDDMTGFALDGGMGEEFHILKLQALSDDGEALWPMKHKPTQLMQMQAADPYMFSGQYQQEPSPIDGEYFKREWLRYYDPAKTPKHLRLYGASDYAVTAAGGDYTVHLVAGVDPNDDIYLLDIWRGQTDSLEWVESFIDLVRQYKPLQWAEETGQITKGIGPLIDKRQRETKCYCFRKQYVMPRGGGAAMTSKQVSAQSIRGRMAQGKVYLPKDAAWIEPFIRELLQFPNGKHDDQIDALSLIGRMLAEMVAAKEPEKPKEWTVPKQPTIAQMLKDHTRTKTKDEQE